MAAELTDQIRTALFEYLLRLGDDRLILGHRLSEWCGHGPILEEDIALANIALDHIGQSEALLQLAGSVEGVGRDEDQLAFLRDSQDFRCCQLVQLPKGDFGFTILRQFFFDVYSVLLWEGLVNSSYEPLSAIAQKNIKECRYHERHSGQWVLRLGDGTEESQQRIQESLDMLWRYTGELFEEDHTQNVLVGEGVVPSFSEFEPKWAEVVHGVLEQATLVISPDSPGKIVGARNGRHTEHLSHLLAEMQVLPRSFPGASW